MQLQNVSHKRLCYETVRDEISNILIYSISLKTSMRDYINTAHRSNWILRKVNVQSKCVDRSLPPVARLARRLTATRRRRSI